MTLTLLQYNTHLFLDSLAGDLDSKLLYEDETRLTEIVDRLRSSGADLVCLEEIWADKTKRHFTGQLGAEYPFFQNDGIDDPFAVGSGLLVLSKFPLRDTSFTRFRKLAGYDALSQEGFLQAQVTLPAGAEFQLITTHTQSGEDSADRSARASNLEQIRNAIASLPSAMPAVVAGDLNVIAEDADGQPTAEYAQLQDGFRTLALTDSFRVLHPDPHCDPGVTFDVVDNPLAIHFNLEDCGQRQRLDYLFARSGDRALAPTSAEVVHDYRFIDPRTGQPNDLSDHYPLRGSWS